MGLLDKGCGQRDVKQKRNAATSIFWKTKKKKSWKNIMPVGSLLVHHAEGHLLMFFF